jgi:hypothetical protein
MSCGKGKFKQADGGLFEGYFKNDKPNGKGKYISGDKKLFLEGEFKDDKLNGEGI